MSPVSLIGLGLNSEKGISMEGLEEARAADSVFAEFYTNPMPNLSLANLESMLGKKVRILDRTNLENENGIRLLEASEKGKTVLLVPGDPMIATTHVSLRLSLAKRGIGCRIVHGASIISAVCGATGLQSYKFGKSITLPKADPVPSSVLNALRENWERSAHTLLLLDVNDGQGRMTAQDSLTRLVNADSSLGERLAVAAVRIGSLDEMVRAGKARSLTRVDLGGPPHCIVFPGRLHFMEEEALKTFGGASDLDLQGNK
jgi:diphthine synthase